MAIRSSLELDAYKSHFETEIIFVTDEAGNPGRIFKLEFKRSLGLSSEMPVTRFQELDVSVTGLLADMRNRIMVRNRNVADLFLEPKPHIAIVRSRANNDILLSPPHPLLMPYYGMVYELILMQKKHTEGMEKALWKVLKRRFGAFLYQQEEEVIERTFGELILSE